MRIRKFNLERAVTIKGAPFTFRTLHSPDQRFGERIGPREVYLDRLMTFTMPAIQGERRRMTPTMEVTL